MRRLIQSGRTGLLSQNRSVVNNQLTLQACVTETKTRESSLGFLRGLVRPIPRGFIHVHTRQNPRDTWSHFAEGIGTRFTKGGDETRAQHSPTRTDGEDADAAGPGARRPGRPAHVEPRAQAGIR